MVRPSHSSAQAAALFRALLAAPEAWRHGYALMQETGLKSGSLYPLLIRLADDGFLDSAWEEVRADARPRRLYRLTPSGRSLAHNRLERFAARQNAGSRRSGAHV